MAAATRFELTSERFIMNARHYKLQTSLVILLTGYLCLTWLFISSMR